MAILLPHIEDPSLTHYIPPKGDFQHFLDDSHYAEKVREWGLSGTKEVKKEFWYKDRTYQRLVSIKGYESYGITGEYNTLVIEFQDGSLSCIHPALLKEMQAASYGKETSSLEQAPRVNVDTEETTKTGEVESKRATTSPSFPSKGKQAKKEKTPKLVLPEGKVHFTGKVKQFGLSWNHFNEENDEVVILENLRIEGDHPLEVGLAWCSHSKTLKKLELTSGVLLEFDGKIVKKSLPKAKDIENEDLLVKDPVPYKVNNPSKIQIH